MNFEEVFSQKKKAIEDMIVQFLPAEEGYQKSVLSAMNYSVTAGGKRLRPMLMLETFQLFGGTSNAIYSFAAAIEMIHNYSLVHDDLPAMDNDEYRRGRKTTHAVYGEAIGILAGDALLNYAFETALTAFAADPENPYIAGSLFYLARKAGVYGMIGGQTVDVESEETDNLDLETLLYIHENKTAALMEAAMCCGAMLAGASREDINKVERVAHNVGIAFQIQDDILDVEGDFETFGKPIGSDAENHKVTYVTVKGLSESKAQVNALTEEAVQLLSELPGDSTFLKELLLSLIHRKN